MNTVYSEGRNLTQLGILSDMEGILRGAPTNRLSTDEGEAGDSAIIQAEVTEVDS